MLDAVCCPALLLTIEARMGDALRARCGAEDILQEALLMAWRDRATYGGSPDLRTFRNWFLSIVDHRIADSRDHFAAQKRGANAHVVPLGNGSSGGVEPAVSTTASRIAGMGEEAAAMREVLDSLPEELRPVVRMRMVEQLTVDEIAAQMGIGTSAVRHRFRRGAELFRYRMTSRLGTRATAAPSASVSATLSRADSSPS